MDNLDILGILRFSMVLKSNRGFPSLVNLSYEERCAILFDKARMEQRFWLLEQTLLPSLLAQSDLDFRLAFLVTPNLPAPYLDRLKGLLRPLPQAFIVSVPPARFLRFGCLRARDQAIRPDASAWATFRIDDDDALAVDYIGRLRRSLSKIRRTTALTFSRGLELSIQAGSHGVMQPDNRPCSGAGLALLCIDDDAASLFPTVYQLGPHRRVGDHVPVMEETSGPGFLRLLHGHNVSHATIRPKVAVVPPDRKAELMGHWFPGNSLGVLERGYPG